MCLLCFFFNDTATTEIYTLSLHDALPISISWVTAGGVVAGVIGPSLVRWTHDQWVPLYLATYAGMVGVHLVVFTIMSFIRFPPPQEAPATAAGSHAGAAPPPPRPLRVIASQP